MLLAFLSGTDFSGTKICNSRIFSFVYCKIIYFIFSIFSVKNAEVYRMRRQYKAHRYKFCEIHFPSKQDADQRFMLYSYILTNTYLDFKSKPGLQGC